MPVSPQEFSLWARMTGNKYPNSVEEKARLAPEVHNFSQNVGKQGALGVKEEPEPEQKSNLGSKLAKGALIAGGIAAGVAAARNPGVQEAVKTASGKASDFISRITSPREINVDTAEAVRDVTNSAPGDVYSQAIIPDPWQVEAKGGEIVSVGDRAQSVIAAIASKYGTNGADEEYVHPSRIPGMPGGDYRGRRTTYAPEQQEAFRLTKQEADERAIIQNEGEIPPGMLTREQQAYLNKEKITNALDQIKNNQLLDKKAADGTLTRAEEGAWLQNELDRSGTTPQELFGHDSIEAYMDTYMPQEKEQSLSNKADAVIEASGESGVSGGSGGTGQTSLSGQADEFLGTMQGPMPPKISDEEAVSMQDRRSSMERQAFDKFVLENKEAIERGEIDPRSEQYHFNQPSLSDAYPNPWADDQEDILRDAAKDNALYKDAAQYEDRDPVSGYEYADIQDKLNEISGKVDPVQQEISNIVSKGHQVRSEAEWQRKSDEDWEAYVREMQGSKEHSVSNKADAVVSALGAADPEFGNTQYSQPESIEAANANPGQNPVNTALSSPQTPDNDVTKIEGTYDQGTLTGQRDIEMAANNAVDQLENLSPEDQVRQRAADVAQSTGKVSKVDKFLSPTENLSAKDWVANERASIQKGLIDSGFKGDPRRLNILVERELADRMSKDAWTYGPEYTRRRQSIELGLMDPALLEEPSKRTVNVSGEDFDRSEFEKPVAMKATAERLEERKEKQRDWSGQIHLEQQSTIAGIYQERKALAEQKGKQVARQIEQAAAAGDQRTVQALTPQLNNLRELWKDPSKGMHREGEVKLAQARIRGVQRTTEEKIAAMQLPTTLSDWTGEGKRVFFEQDPSTGQVNPATVELRSGNRPSRSSIIEDPQTGEYIETGKAKGSQLMEGEKSFYREQPGQTRKPTAYEFLAEKITRPKERAEVDVWTPGQVSRQPEVREINVTREPSQERNLGQEYMAQDPRMRELEGRTPPSKREPIQRRKSYEIRRNLGQDYLGDQYKFW